MKTHHLRRVFVWELPVRIYHWVNALMIVTLVGTGLLIGNPLALKSGGEAYESFWFGWVRFIHFAAAYIFFFNFLFRLYWGFVGNKYADWRNFIPTSKAFFKELWEVLKIDIFLKKDKEHMSVGHNPMAGLTYFLAFLAFMLQALTGFGLYAAMSTSFIAKAFTWVPFAFGGEFALRNLHHITTWFFILFTLVHVYLVFYHDYVEGRGEISSMGGGWKFIEEEAFHAERLAEEAKKNK